MVDDQLNDVSNVLWRERQLLEMLVFKLEEEQLVLASGRTRWLPHATREVEAILEQIRSLELDRAVRVQSLAQELGASTDTSLRELSATAPAPWDMIFVEHRNALLALAHEIDSVAQANRELLARGQHATREALAAIGELETAAYTHSGQATDRSMALRLIDEAL